jgi:hypothetical protein
LAFMVLVAAGSSWLGVKMKQARRQREAVEAIVKLGGGAKYDYELRSDGKPPGPAWLREFLGLDFLADVRVVRL